jgi:hypothetical protein
MARAEKLGTAFIKAHLSHGSRSNSSSGAAHAGAGSVGDRSSTISRGSRIAYLIRVSSMYS